MECMQYIHNLYCVECCFNYSTVECPEHIQALVCHDLGKVLIEYLAMKFECNILTEIRNEKDGKDRKEEIRGHGNETIHFGGKVKVIH